jgi:hypothetical protein
VQTEKGEKQKPTTMKPKNNYDGEQMAAVGDDGRMDDVIKGTKKSTRQQLVDVFESWFEAEPSIYPPNLYDVIKLKEGKQIRQDHNPIVLLYWSNPVSQVLRAMAVKRTTRGRSNFGELMTVKIS